MSLFQGVTYQCVDDEEQLNAVINVLKDVSVCSIDLETSGLSVSHDYIVGIGLSWQEGTGVYIPVNHDKGKNIDYDKALELLKPCLENENTCYVAHNRKFDQTLLGASYLVDDFIKNNPNYVTDLWLSIFHKEMGIQWQPTLFKKLGVNCFVKFDTMAMAYLTGRYMNIGTGGSTASLKKIVLSELGIQMVQIEQLFGVDPNKRSVGKKAKAKKANLIRFETLDPREEIPLPGGDLVSPYQYGCADCDMTLRLFNKLYPQVKDMFLLKVDQGIIPMVKLMELNGVLCDVEEMKRQYKFLISENIKLQTLIYDFVSDKVGAKITFDLGSSAQVGKILFEQLGYPVQERSPKTGKPLTKATVLEAMAKDYPIVKNILYWRSIRKHAEDFFNGMQEHINNITRRIHTSYATAHVISGRFASESPNMQNQPKKASWEIYNPYGDNYEVSCNVRKCYIPPKNFYVLEGDFSQVEYRVFAGRSQARSLLEGYRNNVDMHTKNASMIFQVPEAQVTKKLRSDGKTFSFGIMYGMRAAGISLRIGIPKAECQKYVNNYFQAIPEGVQHIKDITDAAKRNCYVTTHFGRIAHMPEFRSDNSKLRFKAEREAFNITIQGCKIFDEKICTVEDGFMSIGSLFSEEDLKKGIDVAKTVTVWNGYTYVPAMVAYAGLKKQVKIKFKNGMEVITSPEHKFLREDTQKGVHWSRAKDLLGYETNNPDQIKITEPIVSINPDQYFESQIYFDTVVTSHIHNAKNYNANDIFNKLPPFEAGVLLGRLATDGNLSRDVVWIVAEHEKEILPYLEELINRIGWNYYIKSRIREGKQPLYELTVGSASVKRQLIASDIKHSIPKQVSCNIEILRGYLRGFIDGGVSGEQVQITFGKNEEAGFENKESWAREIQKAIMFFGMRCSIGIYERSIRLRIHKGYNAVFLTQIGFINSDKTLKLAKVKPNFRPVRHCQRVESIEFIDEEVPMFDVVNCPDQIYCANGLITHNTAADIMRIALYRLGQTLLKDFGPRFNDVIKPILTTHDSFALYVHRSVDVNKLMAVMRKACEVPITNFPHIKMDFQVGPSYGELLDWGEGIEKYFDTGKDDFGFGSYFDDLKPKNNPDKKPEEDKKVDLNVVSDENKVINKSPVILKVVIPKELNPVEAAAIKNLIAAYPGQNKIVIDFPGGEVPVNRTTSLGLDDESKFQMICTCKLTLDSKSISGKALITGLKL